MSDLVTIDAEVLEDELIIHHGPSGYAVYIAETEDTVSLFYEDEKTAQAFRSGWNAAMYRVEETL